MGIETHLDTPLAEAVRRANGQSAFARLVGRNQSTVFDWLKRDRPLPAEDVLRVEQSTGVSRHLLRPDIYPPEPSSSTSSLCDAGVDPGAPIVACDRSTLLQNRAGA